MQKILWVGIVSVLAISCAKPDAAPSNQNSTLSDSSGDQIYGGEAVSGSSSLEKSVVAIYSEADGGFLCTGTLISEEAVLTAAHCLSSNLSSMKILFGQVANKKTPSVGVTSANRHPAYNSRAKNQQNDLAILFFSGGLPQGFQPASFLDDGGQIQKGQTVTMLGFGVNWYLPGHAGDKKGAGVLRRIDLKVLNPNWSKGEVQIDQTFTRGTCHGDSGGPSFLRVDGNIYLWGVGSRAAGYPLLPCTVDSIYTRVDMYRDWIQNTLESRK